MIQDEDAAQERGPAGQAAHGIGHRARVALMKLYGSARLDDEHDPVVQLEREQGEDSADPEEETPFQVGLREAREREERFRAEQRKGEDMSERPAEG